MERLGGLPLLPVAGGPVLCRSERRIRGKVRPAKAGEVAPVVRDCIERGWPVHPISGGKNWGMGSYLPNADDCVLLDLSALKAIGPLDRESATVRIEAGVTQFELYQWLEREAPELALNVTGAGKDTSLMGNGLERGFGYAGSRADEFFGHEVILADGSEHRPDPEWFSSTGSIPVGPRIDALWSQSNYGIVTAAWIKLRRKQEVEAAVVISGEFDPVFETVRRAYVGNLLIHPVHMAGNNRAGRVSAGLLRQLWGRAATDADVRAIFPIAKGHTAIAAVHGTRRMVKATLAELRAIAERGVKIRAATARQLDFGERMSRRLGLRNRATFIAAIRPLLALTWGEPTDAGLAAIDISERGQDPDLARTGCIYFNAVSPNTQAATMAVESLVAECIEDFSLTRCIMSPGLLIHVFSAFFAIPDASSTSNDVRRVAERLRRAGYPPYRLEVTNMEQQNRLQQSATVLRPSVISPGHYML